MSSPAVFCPPPGKTLWAQSQLDCQRIRRYGISCSTNRAAGSSATSICWCRRSIPEADAAFIIMEPEDTPPMSGSNSICVSTVLLDSGIVPMTEPHDGNVLEAPGGLVEAYGRTAGTARLNVSTIQNVPSFADKLDASYRS